MSVVAWDGRYLAADRQISNGGLKRCSSKMCLMDGGIVLAWTGEQDQGITLLQWYKKGQDPATWPEFQKDRVNWTKLIVGFPGGSVHEYEMLPVPQLIESYPMAWGSGRGYALGAMACGKNAIEAVDIAIRFDIDCGFGVESFDLGITNAK